MGCPYGRAGRFLRLSGDVDMRLRLAQADAKARLIAVEAGTGYAVLRAEDEGRNIFLGHPLLADKPEVVLNVTRSRDWKDWVAEIHNPTDAALTVTVRSNPHVAGLTFAETLTLAAGSSASRRLGAASGR